MQANRKDSLANTAAEADVVRPKNKLVKRKRKKNKGLPVQIGNPLASPPIISPPKAVLPNVRTVSMKKFILELSTEFDETNHILKIAGKEYKIITSDVTDFADAPLPLVSCGSSSQREIIILDPEQSPILQSRYDIYKGILKDAVLKKSNQQLDPKELIDLTNSFIRQHVFVKFFEVVSLVKEIVKICMEYSCIPKISMSDRLTRIPCIPIDIFIGTKVGICRHHALVSAYLMDRYLKHHPHRCNFSGKVQIMRDNTANDFGLGAHAWVTLVCKEDGINKNYSLDSLNDLVGQLEDTEFARLFNRSFGPKAIQHQITKADVLRSKVPELK